MHCIYANVTDVVSGCVSKLQFLFELRQHSSVAVFTHQCSIVVLLICRISYVSNKKVVFLSTGIDLHSHIHVTDFSSIEILVIGQLTDWLSCGLVNSRMPPHVNMLKIRLLKAGFQ